MSWTKQLYGWYVSSSTWKLAMIIDQGRGGEPINPHFGIFINKHSKLVSVLRYSSVLELKRDSVKGMVEMHIKRSYVKYVNQHSAEWLLFTVNISSIPFSENLRNVENLMQCRLYFISGSYKITFNTKYFRSGKI